MQVAESVAAERSLHVQWEPGDEEWVHVVDRRIVCQISKRLPLALVVGDDLAGVIRRSHPRVAVVVISDPDVDELRGSTDVLRRTLLPYGWTDEFDPEAFSALDLFLETT